METKNVIRPVIATGLILLIPLVLQLTIGTGIDGQGWNWTFSDFVIIGMLLFITSLLIEFALKKMGKHKVLAVTVIVIGFFLVYVEMAVGLFTNWGS